MVSPEDEAMRSRRTMMWEPRLGLIAAGAGPPERRAGKAPSARPAQTPVASMTARARMSNSAAVQLVGHVGAADPSALVQRAVGPDPGRHDRATLLGRPGDGQGEAGIVLDPVVEDEGAAQALVTEGGRVFEGRRGPEEAMAAAVVGGAEEVVHPQPRPVERP